MRGLAAKRELPIIARIAKGFLRNKLFFILPAEIMVIALKEVLHEPLVSRAAILTVVAVAITIGVYGVVAMVVKMDDVGLALAERKSPASQRIGVPGVGGVLGWVVNNLASALLGMIIGTILVFIVERLPKRRPKGERDATAATAH